MQEIWKAISGFDGYEVSNLGRVRSLDRIATSPQGRQRKRQGGPMKQAITGGYFVVNLYAETGKKIMRVHRLVAIAFIGDAEPDAVVNHKDGENLTTRPPTLSGRQFKEIQPTLSPPDFSWVEKARITMHARSLNLRFPR